MCGLRNSTRTPPHAASRRLPTDPHRPAPDGISWPDSSEQQAALLATEARRMVADLVAITAAYLATLDALRETLAVVAAAEAAAAAAEPTSKVEGEDAEAEAGVEGKAKAASVDGAGAAKPPAVAPPLPLDAAALDELAAALRSYSESAGGCIKSRYKGLLYAVLLRRLVTRIAQQEEEQAAAAGPGKVEAGEEEAAATEAGSGKEVPGADKATEPVAVAEEGKEEEEQEVRALQQPEVGEKPPAAAARAEASGPQVD